MAVCDWCNQEMLETVSCTVAAFHRNGEPVPRKKYWGRNPAKRCEDCGTPRGGYHHPGCDQERCPLCPPRRQAISCGCRYDEDPADPGDEDPYEGDPDEVDLGLEGRRAVWNVDGRSVLLDERGLSPLGEW